ncbi:TPA: hypothetical protein ACIVDT_003577, partial [Salmonella enterica subsp. enterica serovar Eastbourne]
MNIRYFKTITFPHVYQHTHVLDEYGYLGTRTIRKGTTLFEKVNNSFRTDKSQELSGCTIEGRNIKISLKRINTNILNSIKVRGKDEMQGWKNDERKVYLSLVINQEIDKFCNLNNCGFSRHERDQVFTIISDYYNLSLNSCCAQSFLNQMVSGNKYFRSKMDKLCQGMNRNEKNRTEY